MSQFLDIGPFGGREHDHVLEWVGKALSGSDARIWSAHPLPDVAVAETAHYEWWAGRLGRVYAEIVREAGLRVAEPAVGPQMFAKSGPDEEPDFAATGIDSWMKVVDRLIKRYMAPDDGAAEAEAAAVRAFLVGRVKHALKAWPKRIKAAIKGERLTDQDRWALEHLRARGATSVQGMTEQARERVKRTLVVAHQERVPPMVTAGRLRDELGDLNRDWRRIAITETAEAHGQGMLAGLAPGTRVRRVEPPDCCSPCQAFNGVVLTVVPPEGPHDWDAEVWVGKSNVGRSRHQFRRTADGVEKRDDSELWKPCPVIHPHCRGYFEVVRGG